MYLLPLFRGAFAIARKGKECDQAILRTALKQADKHGFRVADYSDAQHLKLATLSQGNDKRLRDTFSKQGIEFTYSKKLPDSPASKPLTLTQQIGKQLQHPFIKH